ncbi:hypothetical protein [Sphingomonas desiccabilis]|uniref:Uncharacterized protein n=1 Tax=Sphingomonas desiccabilis TaxID=429134 RepID=A0A4Q2ITK1_9SPHN|nr:hypothetical protein [Sphingomonas desiccabilis]MBB3911510.1 hypothetical protein [Sphingomonas desiccabilis]RXZ31731.1 hypothetical protein EO081_10995 [Sphingomonas desiccabilis]
MLAGGGQNIGDVEQRGASAAAGVYYYGLVDPAATSDERRGAQLTVRVNEVTEIPDYCWRD